MSEFHYSSRSDRTKRNYFFLLPAPCSPLRSFSTPLRSFIHPATLFGQPLKMETGRRVEESLYYTFIISRTDPHSFTMEKRT